MSLPHWVGIIGNHDEFLYHTIRTEATVGNPEWARLVGLPSLPSIGVSINSQDNDYIISSSILFGLQPNG